jgi:hypothetical protein
MDTKRKIFAAMCRSNVLLGGHGGLPSKHRIGSTTGANADQSGGIMLHDFLPRVIFHAFRTWNDAAAADDDGDDDYRKMVRKKVWRVLHTMEEENKVQRLIANWLAAPLDHCWMVIQKLDGEGHILRTLVHNDTSPFAAVSRAYTKMIVEPLSDGPLKSLMHHFRAQFELGYMSKDSATTENDIIDDIRTLTCSLICQVRWRCEWLFEGNPFQAYLMVDNRLDKEAQLRIAVQIHSSLDCELDPFFLRKAFQRAPH